MWPWVPSSGGPARQGLEQMDPEGPAKPSHSVIFRWIALERCELAVHCECDKVGIAPAEAGELECENTGQCRNPPGVFWGRDLSCLRWVGSFLLLPQILKRKFLISTYKQSQSWCSSRLPIRRNVGHTVFFLKCRLNLVLLMQIYVNCTIHFLQCTERWADQKEAFLSLFEVM